jgi:hypothetical protein
VELSMSVLPERLAVMAEQALAAVASARERDELRVVARVISTAAWQHWYAWRPREDNRQEHEWVVLGNVLKIAEHEGFPLSDKRVAVAFTFLHDTYFIPRITETMIRAARDEATRAELLAGKTRQRLEHMEGGAANARILLGRLKHPERPQETLLTSQEIDRCVEIISQHDLWKMRKPYPPGSDRLAVACVEADALYPLHPLGVLADLERPDDQGPCRDAGHPGEWTKQLGNNLLTLLEYRANWKDVAGETFVDDESIFRTQEGHRLYREWRKFWNI